MQLEDYLKEHARTHPRKTAVVYQDHAVSYEELDGQVDRYAAQLRGDGVGAGQVVCFRNSQSPEFLYTYFALHRIGAVALPLERDTPESKKEEIEKRYAHFTPPSDIADILFTTGTTGRSKGVMISHDTILADGENLIEAHGYTRDHVFIINGPLNHIGSLSKIYPVMMTGGTLYLLESMKDLNAFFHALDYPCEKMGTFLVPSSARILLQLARKQLGGYADKIDFIETGAAPMSRSDMEALCQVLPKSRLFNTYASTETGIICTYNFNDGQCTAGCLGRPMKHSSVFITESGHVACSGKTLMSGYADDEAMTQAVLRDGVVYTADNGEIDSQGMLHLLGRDDDVINVGGFKVSPSEVEDVAQGHPSIKDCICIAVPSPITGNAVKLLYSTSNGEEIARRDLALFIASKLERYKVPMQYERVDEIKRTFNGKLDRKKYKNFEC